jgi:hypothetical protein
MVVASIFWSSGGLCASSITEAWEIVFWRKRLHGAVRGRRARRDARAAHAASRAVGWPGLTSGTFLACTFFFFIASLARTTVANTFADERGAVPRRSPELC